MLEVAAVQCIRLMTLAHKLVAQVATEAAAQVPMAARAAQPTQFEEVMVMTRRAVVVAVVAWVVASLPQLYLAETAAAESLSSGGNFNKGE